MKVYPMDRALPGQFSITLVFVIYSVYLALSTVAGKINMRYLLPLLLAIFMLFLDGNYLDKDRKYITHNQCHFPVNYWYTLLTDGINAAIPKGSSVAFSDESFYWYYLCRKDGYNVSKCARGNEQYLIKLRSETFFMGTEQDFFAREVSGRFLTFT